MEHALSTWRSSEIHKPSSILFELTFKDGRKNSHLTYDFYRLAAALAVNSIRSLRFPSSWEAALAADLIRNLDFLSSGCCTGSRLDHMSIIRGGCASSRLNQELEVSIVWGAALAANLIRSLIFQSSGEVALAADLIRSSKFLPFGG